MMIEKSQEMIEKSPEMIEKSQELSRNLFFF